MNRLHSYDESEISFYYIDENAKRVLPKDVDNFHNLMTYLKQPIQNARHAELYLVRGILVWIAHNQSHSGPNARYNTPLWFTQQLVKRRISPADVFRTFCGTYCEFINQDWSKGDNSPLHRNQKCRYHYITHGCQGDSGYCQPLYWRVQGYAGIECEEISGRAKAIRYRAGDGDLEHLKDHTWIAFKADDKWHLMHPVWSIQVYIGYEHGGEIQIELDGLETVRVKVQRDGQTMYIINDFWFCTAPEIFVTRCFPDESKWQNPDGSILIKNVGDFLSLPDLRQGFYDMRLSLLSEQSCTLLSKNGKCYISLMADKDLARAIDFSYELVMEGTSSDNFNVKDMKQLVLHQVCGKDRNIFKFEIRLPVVGIYWLRLAVGSAEEPGTKRNCCEFKIACIEACKNCKRFPTCAGLGVYGYGPQAEDAGLLNSSQTDAKINIKPNSTKSKNEKLTVAKFQTDNDPERDMQYDAEMYMCGSDVVDGENIDIQLEGTTEVIHDKTNDELIVNVGVPREGEYALVIKARDRNDKSAEKSKPVAGYLVTTDNDKDEERNNALTKEREKEVRRDLNMKSKLEKRNALAEILDATIKECNALQVSGKRN